MNTWIKVTRFHLLGEPVLYVAWPWLIAALNFAVALVVFSQTSGPLNGTSVRYDPAAPASFYIVFVVVGLTSITWALPFALSLGMTRRSYYLGTALSGVALCAANGLLLALLQVAEVATHGWGIGVHQFWQVWILQGPWYLTWWTSFAILFLSFIYGTSWGIVYLRWRLLGLLAFTTGQTAVLLAAIMMVSRANAWPAIFRFFATLGPAGLTDVLIVVALLLSAVGYATIRRAAV